METIIFIIMALLQPICLPLPEMSTIFYGSVVLGATKAFIIGYICILIGIAFMYKVTFLFSEKHLNKLKEKNSFKKFQNYVENNQIITLGLLFILPILPDEIICIGSAILGIDFTIFMIVAVFAKFISIGMIAYADVFSNILNINQYMVIIVELIIIFISSHIYKYYKEKK